MAESANRGGFFGRMGHLLSKPVPWFPDPVVDASKAATAPKSNGNGAHPSGVKSAIDLLPRMNGAADFFSDDGGRTFHELGPTGLAFAAYWYVACRWRAQKIAEAPLMVVAEDQDDGSEEWLADHDLAGVLDSPSPDYDMGELLERTSRYLDDHGSVLWVMDRDRAGRVARLTPFHADEFSVEKANGRLYGKFTVQTSEGPKPFKPEEVCYFRDTTDGWSTGKARLDVALSWLNLGEKAKTTIRDLLNNSVWPSILLIPDKDWAPDPATFEAYKADVQKYGQSGSKGKPFVMLGGGSAETLSARIRDLVPTEVLDRVESVVSAISGVPAIVLQFQVGMENSPWSQMEQARRMAYDDTIQPSWRRIERVLTRQLLRLDDEDPTHFVRFDPSKIPSLQEDRAALAEVSLKKAQIARALTPVGSDPLELVTVDDEENVHLKPWVKGKPPRDIMTAPDPNQVLPSTDEQGDTEEDNAP